MSARFAVFEPRVVPGHTHTPWKSVPTAVGSLKDAVKLVGGVTLANWQPGHRGIIAHRGYANQDCPDEPPVYECTARALTECIDMGVSTAETDATPNHYAGRAVLFHDKLLGRWTKELGPAESSHLADLTYVTRNIDVDKLRITTISQVSDTPLLYLRDATELVSSNEGLLSLLLDCRFEAGPKVAAEVSHYEPSLRDRVIIQVQNTFPGSVHDFIAAVEAQHPAADWVQTMQFAPSANQVEFSRRVVGNESELTYENGVESNFDWLEGFANNLRIAGFVIRRTGAAEDFESGTNPRFLGGPGLVRNPKDRIVFERDRIARELQRRCRERFQRPIICPAPMPDIVTDNGRYYSTTWADPMQLVEMQPETSAFDFYTAAVADPRVALKCGADFVMTDNVPWAAYEIVKSQE